MKTQIIFDKNRLLVEVKRENNEIAGYGVFEDLRNNKFRLLSLFYTNNEVKQMIYDELAQYAFGEEEIV